MSAGTFMVNDNGDVRSIAVYPRRHGDGALQAITVTHEFLLPYFDRPLQDAADKLGVCCTTMKKICRKLGIERWPNTSRPSRGSQIRKQPSPRRTVTSSPPSADGSTEFEKVKEETSDHSSSDLSDQHCRERQAGTEPPVRRDLVLKRELDPLIRDNMRLLAYWQTQDLDSSSSASGGANSVDVSVMELQRTRTALFQSAHATLMHRGSQPSTSQHAAEREPWGTQQGVPEESTVPSPRDPATSSVERTQEEIGDTSAFWREDPFNCLDSLFWPQQGADSQPSQLNASGWS